MTQFDVVAIGNAIVDVLAYCEESFLTAHKLTKGSMALINEQQASELYKAMGVTTECSGGSAANTLAGLAGLGARTAFVGKVFDDQLGSIFRHDMRATGMVFDTPASTQGKATASCMINVTPDAQRTMCTFLGACTHLRKADIDAAQIKNAKVLYVEGYLWDDEETKKTLRHAMDIATQAGVKVAFTLSDSFCVDRHHGEFVELAKGPIDWLFANEQEALKLAETDDIEAAKKTLSGWVDIVALTQSDKGSTLVRGSEEAIIEAITYGKVLDTTGAGDLYAAGVLYGLTHDFGLKESGNLGSRLAGHIISQLGARSQTPLKALLDEKKAA